MQCLVNSNSGRFLSWDVFAVLVFHSNFKLLHISTGRHAHKPAPGVWQWYDYVYVAGWLFICKHQFIRVCACSAISFQLKCMEMSLPNVCCVCMGCLYVPEFAKRDHFGAK